MHPGGPRGDYNINDYGKGGGLVRIHTGLFILEGTITASSEDTSSSSGGGIWITASRKMTIAPSAKLLAKGGSKVTTVGREGGGGRIALGLKLTDNQLVSLAATGELPEHEPAKIYESEEFLERFPGVAIDVSPGDPWDAPEGFGTFRFLDSTKNGTVLLLR